MYFLKIHETPKGSVIAACDRDLLGSRFSEGEKVLDIDEDFYGGNESDMDEIVSSLQGCLTANIVGEGIVSELIERDIVEKENVSEVNGVPMVQLFYI